MKKRAVRSPQVFRLLVGILIPFAYLLFLWGINRREFTAGQVLIHFCAAFVIIAGTTSVLRLKPRVWVRIAGLVIVWGLWLASAAWGQTVASTVALACLLMWMFAVGIWCIGASKWRMVWIGAVVCGSAALLVIATAMIRSHFAEEEFFSAVQGLLLLIGLALSWVMIGWLNRADQVSQMRPVNVPLWWIVSGGLISLIALSINYPQSFYPQNAPIYPGITAEAPFLCGEAAHLSNEVYDAAVVRTQIINLLENNPQKSTPEFGQLALMTQQADWRQTFREALLADARAGLYTGPANSVKYGQYSAALRAYFYWKVNLAYPDLFSTQEQNEIRDWLGAVNQRALTAEWVDWLYALAFAEIPQGPYLNQENGAGLLSVLEGTGLAKPEWTQRNQAFLATHRMGWTDHFRNIDDSISYQSTWINNALFQSMSSNQDDPLKRQLSFRWAFLQALPNGSATGYNPSKISLTNIAYLGAVLLNDPELLWLAGKSSERLSNQQGMLFAQPGAEALVDIVGNAPATGSCLLFGESGNSNVIGPLAPDKVVFRSGWNADDSYLMLNLRFVGWHRYKATNTIIAIDQDGPIVIEDLSGSWANWLPVGRGQFRDKRIPRENLNGLLIEKQGVDALIYYLTGFGSRWAQDPPFYANVDQFSTSAIDGSTTRIRDWNGWDHARQIQFDPRGVIIVHDLAQGESLNRPQIMWHIAVPHDSILPDKISPGQPLIVGDNGQAVMQAWEIRNDQSEIFGALDSKKNVGQLSIQAGMTRKIETITVFLVGDWHNAKAQLAETAQGVAVQVSLNGETISFPLDR